MNKIVKYLLLVTLLTGGFNLFSGITGRSGFYTHTPTPEVMLQQQQPPQDTAINVRYPVKKTQATNYDDLLEKPPVDLRDPSNIKTEVEYDIKNNVYLFRTKIGDQEWSTPFSMTQEEYSDYTMKQSMFNYFKIKNNEAVEKGNTTEDFALKDIKIPMGAAEKIFGPGGIKARPQGYAEFSVGLKRTSNENPTLSERRRTSTIFNVDQKIQLNVNASIGDKMSFDLNYDTEATFDFDSKKLKLAYEGKEDEIIRYLEAGNVSLNTTNSLIQGANSLFGIRADLQFGKLRINTVISQQESESKTVGSKGGVQTTPFEFSASDYEENKHFFLGHYFRDRYNLFMEDLPNTSSPVTIKNIEVWVTNKRGNNEQSRNIVAFADLAEYDSIRNTIKWKPLTSGYPQNNSNTLYPTVGDTTGGVYQGIRDITQTTRILTGIDLKVGLDFEKIESARLLSSTEYTYHSKLGYLSLNYTPQSDEVVGVAYEYIVDGKTYKVGEFASDITSSYIGDGKSGALILKLLKPVSMSPYSYSWNLMMKNVYSLSAYNVQSDRFRLDISYQSDTTGTYINYIPEGNIKNERLLRVMNLDRLDTRNKANSDGIFDFVEGYTIRSANGRVYFPVVEPFGKHLADKIGNSAIAQKYVYQELYDSTLTVAKQIAEKNKFKIKGTYKASNNNEIDLGATNVVRGSVKVTAGGTVLTEGSDYTVDYASGRVTIINESIIDAGTSISATIENQPFATMQKKTLLGLNLSYDFSKDFNIGATFMHMYEKPLTTKTTIGNESLKNTLFGFNASYRTESQWLTNLLDKLPFVEATQPSQISFNGEYAQMIPGHYTSKYAGGYSYLDDFESSRSKLSIKDPYAWNLASTPVDDEIFDPTKGEGGRKDSLDYGKGRALLAWYYIDNLFTRRNSSLRPRHIDNEQLSNHFVREIRVSELYPNRDAAYNETSTIPVLNLSYYPKERGPYNLDAEKVNTDGTLMNPEDRWGGMMRKLDYKDFETQNIEYIEFWLMDPFVYNDNPEMMPRNEGGKLYINLGEVSEDILKDGKKFYENGLPTIKTSDEVDQTYWGYVPRRPSTVYGFDNNQGTLEAQDVGYNGLSSEEEKTFGTYQEYLNNLRLRLSAETITNMQNDPFSPFNDPAGDNFHYFRGSDYDRDEVSILGRYKRINGTEGNTVGSGDESYSTSMKTGPDVEDLDQDYTMNETESYYRYTIDLDPNHMVVGDNHIADKRDVTVELANGKPGSVTWYQFKVPVKSYDKNNGRIGNIRDFKSIRFMRMYMKGFKEETHLRFASLDLVRGEWREYTQSLQEDGSTSSSKLEVTSVNIEENGDREPVNYVLPPGETRILDPGQPQLRQENEQALSFKITDLESQQRRAIYKNSYNDLRRYKRIQMYTHAESVVGKTPLKKGDLSVFMRLGTDYKNNYYEYEIPLTITPEGQYSGNNYNDQLAVWPQDNMFDFALEILKNLKLERNKEKRKAGSAVTFTTPYTGYDPERPSNRITVMGNPSLAEVNVIMIGVRNTSNSSKSGEVWVNELRLTDFDEEGGWAAQGSLNIAFSDIGTLSITGRKETAGFGSIDQSLMERRQDDYYTYSISTNFDAGRFLPEKIKASIPVYYSYTNETTTPKYDPYDQDVTLEEALSVVNTKAEKDSIKSLAQDKTTSKNFSISGAKLNIRSKTPMPYDPANFTFGYAQSITETKNPTTVYDQQKRYSATFSYNYSPITKTWSPFKNTKGKAPMARYAKTLGFNYLPNNISINSNISRYYTETVTRDLEGYISGEGTKNTDFLSHSSDFYWDRDLSLSWDFTKNLKANIQTGTKAEIEEPFLQVNKEQNPDDYSTWKKAVNKSIRSLGDPLSYRQNASVTYTLPFNDISFMNWINSNASYNSTYSWERGASSLQEDINPITGSIDTTEVYKNGHNISNSFSFSLNSRFNMVTLYNKWAFLRKVNQKFDGRSSTSSVRGQTRQAGQTAQKKEEKKPRKFEKTIMLADSAITVKHNLNTKNLRVTARRADTDKRYPIKFKKGDNNSIKITNKDSVNVKLTIVQGPDPEETFWYKFAQYSARGLMSVRSVQVNYTKRKENHIYGFNHDIGDFFGQSKNMVPGLGFAFGFDGGEDFIDKSLDRDWLVKGNDMANPAVLNNMEKMEIRAQLEPVRGLKIELNGSRENNNQNTIQITSNGSKVKTYGGSFSMSILTISSAFESVNANNGYYSKTFEKFLDNREEIRSRLQKKYDNIGKYPDAGFIKDMNMGGQDYSSVNGAVNANSADVLIPAFLAAYTGKDVKSSKLSPFLGLASMIPGWTINYDGLTTLPWFKDKFKSFKLSHSYNSRYQVGSYSSFSDWVDAGGGLGFTENTLVSDETIMPSSGYNINSVTIVEQFRPLFGAEGTMNNNLTLRARYNKDRSLTLNISSYQIVETRSNEFVVGLGYRINEFNRLIGLTSRTAKTQSGFNNDLNVTFDFSHRSTQSLLRKIEERYTQATSGTTVSTIKVSADYALSKNLTLRAYFDKVINKPLISANSYPTSDTNFGLSIRFTLTQ